MTAEKRTAGADDAGTSEISSPTTAGSAHRTGKSEEVAAPVTATPITTDAMQAAQVVVQQEQPPPQQARRVDDGRSLPSTSTGTVLVNQEDKDVSRSESPWGSPSLELGQDKSLRTNKTGCDLREGFQAAVSSTMSHAVPLGAPATMPDEIPSSSDSQPETLSPIPQRNRRMSAITRAEQAALSLSKPALSSNSPPLMGGAGAALGEREKTPRNQSEKAAVGFSRTAMENFGEISWRRYLTAAPVYPGGVGGRLTASGLPGPPSPRSRLTTQRSYRMLFESKFEAEENTRQSQASDFTVELEAVMEASGGSSLCIRVAGDVSTSPKTVARILEVQQSGGTEGSTSTREALYSVVLDGGKAEEGSSGAGGGRVGGEELMAVRVSTHPTRLAVPREVQAVLVISDSGGTEDRMEGQESVPVWISDGVAGKDGLWQAAAQGRADAGCIELRNKPAVWSPATESFELDFLEAWRPCRPRPGSSVSSYTSPSAPETVQMVAASSSAKAGCGTAAKNSARGAENRRVPAMQFVRTAFAIAREDDAARSETSFDPSAASKAKVDDGARDGLESGAGGSAGAGWTVAVSSPMSVLQAFALAVIGLETSIVGASVRVVDRSAVSAETEREAAAGFTGFDEILTKSPIKQKNNSSSRSGSRVERLHPHSGRSIESERSTSTRSHAAASARPTSYVPGSASEHSVDDRGDDVIISTRVTSSGGTGQGADEAARDNTQGDPNAVPALVLGVAVPAEGGGHYDRITNRHGCIQLSARNRAGAGTSAPDRESVTTGSDGGGGHEGGRGTHAEQVVESPSVAVPVKRRLSVQAVAAEVADKVYRNTYVCNLCLLTLLIAFVADIYPGGPSHNAPLAAALLWASCNVDAVRSLRRRSFAYALSVVVLISLFMDVDFLASDLEAYALAELQEQDDSLPSVVVANDMHKFGRIAVGVVAVLKTLSWQGLLATCPQGVHVMNLLWRRFKLFLPIWGSPRKLTKEVYDRLVALAWAHLLSAVALATTAGVAALQFGWAPQFASAQGAGIPVSAICFAKSITDLLVSAALFRNMDLALCLNVFGCLSCFQGWHRAREERRRNKHGVTYPKIILEWDYIMLCGYIKTFDLVVGLWLWIGLGWAWSTDRDYSDHESVRALLISITVAQTLTDVWCVFLGITVSLLVSQYLLRKEKSVGNARGAFGGDGDIEISRNRLLAISPDSSVYEDERRKQLDRGKSGYFQSDEDHRGGDNAGGRADSLQSDVDSYSTGTSETEQEEDSGRQDTRTPSTRGRPLSTLDTHHDETDRRDGNSAHQSTPATALGVDIRVTEASRVVREQPIAGMGRGGGGGGGGGDGEEGGVGVAAFDRPRRRSVFAPGGNRLAYKRAFSSRSSSDDSVVGNGYEGLPPLPATLTLDRLFVAEGEDFKNAWASLPVCASFRCRIGRMPDVETVASHLRTQGFFVVASGVVSYHTKIYASAKGMGVSNLFYAELVFEKAMHELAFAFKCEDERLTPHFVCHLHLRRIIGDHQPIA